MSSQQTGILDEWPWLAALYRPRKPQSETVHRPAFVKPRALYVASVSLSRLWHEHHGKCHYCKRMTTLAYDKASYHLRATRDHYIPRSQGGRGQWNVVLACRECNQAKGDLMPTTRLLHQLAGRQYQLVSLDRKVRQRRAAECSFLPTD